jgi:hypothetical protein
MYCVERDGFGVVRLRQRCRDQFTLHWALVENNHLKKRKKERKKKHDGPLGIGFFPLRNGF